MPVLRIILYRNQNMYFYSIMNSLRSSSFTLCRPPLQLLKSLNIIRTVIPPSYPISPMALMFNQYLSKLKQKYLYDKSGFSMEHTTCLNIQFITHVPFRYHQREEGGLCFVPYTDLIMSHVWVGWLADCLPQTWPDCQHIRVNRYNG